ncbi:MAG: DNA-directed DNA polymerase II small subunit [Candidatus Bathyarchaeota archaeon]|nr:DNA-directed DNA polymerase II small subunit [Candidatus Bathyarchaeota archaeon]
MSEKEKLQRAVESTIAAGYQLDKEAFDFLRTVATTDDPTIIIHRALQKIEALEEKPLFICKSFLEATFAQSITTKVQQQAQPQFIQKSTFETPTVMFEASENNESFYPYAKDVDSKIEIVEDSTGKLSSNGTMEDYLQYFQDRFKRMEKLLRQRMDVKAATPIAEALKAQAKTKLKIIGMVQEKRESKQQLFITIEDLNASATILIPSKAPEEVHKKAQMLLPDQVICVAVIKTMSQLFIAEDIIFPEVGQRPNHRSPEPVYAVLTSDIHVGSAKFNKEAFKRFLLWLNGKYGDAQMKQIASHTKYVLIAGDLVDGVGVFPGQAKELVIKDVHKQYRLAAKILGKIPQHIEIIISPGNHDAPRKALPQPSISEEFLPTSQGSRKLYSLSNPCRVSLHSVEVLMYHGRSLDDIIGAVPDIDHEHPEKAMKLLMQGRHLAPMYGGKTLLSPENRDYLVIDKAPEIFHAGHIHVLGCCNYRGVLVVNSGGWQDQTEYMAKLGLVPTPGKVPVVNLKTLETTILSFI